MRQYLCGARRGAVGRARAARTRANRETLRYIVADKATEVGPRVSGIIDAVHVDVGAQVAAGDPLFTTRQVDYRLRLAEATHARRLARAEAANARRQLER
jgi:multidrug resistance efflux pump